MSDDWFSNLIQGRGESSGLLVAFAVGAFGILVLFAQQNVSLFSLAWFALSIAYWLIVVNAFLTVRAWGWHALMIEYHANDYNEKNMPQETKKKLKSERKLSRLMRFAVDDYSDGAGKSLKNFIIASAIGVLIIGGFLYVTLAFKMLNPLF